jgi:hypothetical protein
MPDRNQENERNSAPDNQNSKAPGEIDKAPKQDIQNAHLESQKGKKVDADPTEESDRPVEQ